MESRIDAFRRIYREIRGGNRTAEDELYRIMRVDLGVFLRSSLWPRLQPEAEDIIHDAYVTVLQHMRDGIIREEAHAYTYASRVMLYYRHTKQRKRHSKTVQERAFEWYFNPSPFRPPYDDKILRDQQIAILMVALAGPEIRLTVLRLFYFGEQSGDAIQEKLGLSRTAYRNLKHRGLQDLRAQVQQVA